MKLLFINSLKGLKKKKIQMLGIIMMVMLSTGIYVTMSAALDRLEGRYYNYLEEQNVEYVSFSSFVDYKVDVTTTDIENLKKTLFLNLTSEEESAINAYECALNPACDYIGNNLLENKEFLFSVSNIFKKYEADTYIEEKKIDTIKEKYNFYYELDLSKTLKEDNTYIQVIPYNSLKTINKIYLIEGKLPLNDNEITILPKYAKIHNIKIGDNYTINNTKYKVVGFAYAPDYIYPLLSFSSPIFDEAKNNIVYTNQNTYKQINGVNNKSYSVIFNSGVERKFKFSMSSDTETADPITQITKNETKIMYMDANTIVRIGRIGALQLEFANDRLFAEYFLYLLLGIAVFIIGIITKKRIEDEKLQIGVLKSLGYNPFSIAVSYLVYPIIGALIGGVLGYLIGMLCHEPLANYYVNWFLVPMGDFKINLQYLVNSIVIPVVFLSLLSYLIAIFMLRKKPLSLLKEGSNLKVNLFSKICNKITSIFPFKYRFKYSLAFRSLSKLLIVALTSFFTGMLIVLTLIGMNLMSNMIEKSFAGATYTYEVDMAGVEQVEFDETAEYVLGSSFTLSKITDKNGSKKDLEKDVKSTLLGIDTDSKFIKLLDKSNKNNISELDNKESVIITANMANLYNIVIGDILTFDNNGTLMTYTVSNICEEFMYVRGYVNRESLSLKLGYENNIYNALLTNDNKYSNLESLTEEQVSKISNIINLKDLKSNIDNSMEMYNASIYIVIAFASLMALIIIAVIANIVVEENKKTISLMKVMGYKNKQISSIVLNIYTPIIVIAYLVSIPAMVSLLEKIVSALSGDMDITIPISLDPKLAFVGLVGLVAAYYIAIALSKRVLNKIPLAIALKRE